jgi:hypothetical protein
MTLPLMNWREARQLVAMGFVCGSDERLALHRIPIAGRDSLLDSIWRLHTALALGEFVAAKVHGAWRRVRHLGVG